MDESGRKRGGRRRRWKLVVADDEPYVLQALEEIFAREGFRVKTARDGLEAVERVHRDPPDLVVLNYLMPVMDGFRACRALKAAPSTRHIPVIIHSGCAGDVGWVYEAFMLGASDYVSTPFSPRDYVERVRSALRRAYGR